MRLGSRPWFPGPFQWVSGGVFLPVLAWLLFGPPESSNPANLLVWGVWWPLLCVLFLIAGRVWCSLCPFPLLGTAAQRAAGLQLAVPDFLKRHGAWLITIAFFLLSWMEETIEAVESPRKTAVVLLAIQTGAVAFSLFFRGRAWCRHVCPLGGISLAYARTALLKVRTSEGTCAECLTKDCVVPDSRYAGCPMQLSPFAIDTVSNCSFCGSCVRRCPNQSLYLSLEAPSLDLSGRSPMSPVVPWLIVLLAGQLLFLNLVRSPVLPFAGWLASSANPVLQKTLLMAASMALCHLLFQASARLAAGSRSAALRERFLQLGALPMIPLLLLGHLGHLGPHVWRAAGRAVAFAADPGGIGRAMGVLPASWLAAFGASCLALGLASALWVSRWVMAQEPDLPASRVRRSFGLFYLLYAAGNLVASWPAPGAAPAANAGGPAAAAGPDGWAVLWPFVGVNVALLALAVVVSRSDGRASGGTRPPDFSATRSWAIGDRGDAMQTEILEWLLEQAVQAGWRIRPVVGLANATSEILAFLQRTLSDPSTITVHAVLRKNKGVITLSHAGRPLTLPEHRAVTSLDDAGSDALDGLELRLAEAQVERVSYHARLSDGRCSFTLHQPCPAATPEPSTAA